MGKFTIKPTNTGYVFNLKAGNGEVIAVSQVYKSLDGAKNGIASVRPSKAMLPRRTRSSRSIPTRPANSVSA